jgi:predicted dehydrogenase
MKKEINIGIIGAQFMGRAHSNGYLQAETFFSLREKPVLKAACDINLQVLEPFAKVFGWQSIETSWEKLIKRDDIDLIDICTANSLHMPLALAAAKSGKHIICEKPLARNSQEARVMLDAVNEAGVKHMVAFNYRRVPAIAFAKKLIEEGKIGKVYHFNSVYYQDWLLDPNVPFSWRLDAKECGLGGASGEMSSHIIDLARYLVGELEAVCADATVFIKKRPFSSGNGKGIVTTDDAANILARFSNGALGTFLGTRFAPGRKNYMRLEIFGSDGSLVFNLERMNELEYYTTNDDPSVRGFRNILITESVHPYMKSWWPPGHIIGWEHTFVHEIAAMLGSIAENLPIQPDFYDGYRCQQVLDAITESIYEKKWIKIPEK